MKITFEYRRQIVLDEEKSSDVLTEFPRFRDVKGLVEQDFILKFGEDVAAKFLERWPTTFKQKIIQQSKALPTTNDLEELIYCAEMKGKGMRPLLALDGTVIFPQLSFSST
ncbi:unnamed protein product [Arctogadus glacialis]